MVDILLICSTLELSHLTLGDIRVLDPNTATFDLRLALAMAAAGKTSGLRELVLRLTAAQAPHLSGLTALTALTCLDLRIWNAVVDLGTVARLTGLKSLRMISTFVGDVRTLDITLSPLSALTGLTLLEMDVKGVLRRTIFDASALSALTALRVMRCGLFEDADFVDDNPLPTQMFFLRLAKACPGFGGVHLGAFVCYDPCNAGDAGGGDSAASPQGGQRPSSSGRAGAVLCAPQRIRRTAID